MISKKIIIFTLILTFLAVPLFAQLDPIGYIDQESGAEMLSLRYFGEKLGWQVDWDDATRSVLLTKGEMSGKVKIGEDVYIANIKIPYILEAKAIIIDDRSYVPASFFPTVLLEGIE